MVIQFQKQFRVVEIVVEKSLYLELTEYNINYTNKREKKKRTNRQKSDRTKQDAIL